MTSNINSTINRGLNVGASALESIIYCNFLPATMLGAAGGWLVGVGPKLGLFQGLTTYAFYAYVIKPSSNYVNANLGEGPDKINKNTRNILSVIGGVAGFIIPILVTRKVGPRSVQALNPYLLKWNKTIFGSQPATELATQSKKYTILQGFKVNIAPAAVQYSIENIRDLYKQMR